MTSVRKVTDAARPLVSANKEEARFKALRLYRLWFRFIPYVKHQHWSYIPPTVPELRQKLKSEFRKNKNIKDLRVIDLLIHRGRIDLYDFGNLYSQQCHIMGQFYKDTVKPKPNTFLEKFFSSKD